MELQATSADRQQPAALNHIVRYGGALLMVAVATVIGLLIVPHWGGEPVVLLFIPPVLMAAIYCGLWPALLAAIAATLAYNFFFTEPYHTFLIDRPADIVTVVVLLLVVLVTSRLVGMLRERELDAAAHAGRNATIAGLARRLLSCTSEQDIARVTVHELHRLFNCNAVLVTGRDEPRLLASAPSTQPLAPSDFAAAALTLNTGEPAGRGVKRVNLADWQFHAVAAEQSVVAAVGLARADGMPPVGEDQLQLFANLLDQVALALERARLDREAREMVSLRERDRLRSALLASIGEDLKPRLNAIRAATRALRRGSADKTFVSTLSTEAAKLDRYIDNLVDLSPGSDQTPLEIGPVTIDLYQRAVHKDGIKVHLTPKEYAVLAELAKHAGRVLTHSYLLRTVWGPAQQQHVDYLRVAIRSLRQKLERNAARPELIVNEPAVGYCLAATAPDVSADALKGSGAGSGNRTRITSLEG